MSDTSSASPAPATAAAAVKRRFMRNPRFSIGQAGIAMILAVLLVPFLLWRLGTEKYGLWLTLQVFSILGLVSLAELGLQGAVVRYLVRFHAQGDALAFRRLLVASFLLFALIGAVCSGALIVFAQTAFLDLFAIPEAYEGEMRLALTVYALGLLIAFPGLILKAFFAGIQDVATVKLWEALDRILFSAGVVALLFFSERLLHMVLVEQAVMLTLLVGFALLARSRLPDWFTLNPRQASVQSLRGLTGLSGAVFATSISNQVYIKAPEALIGAGLGPVALAYYQIATRLPRVLKAIQGALNAAVLPYLVGIERDDDESPLAKRRFAMAALRANYLIFVPIAAFTVVFAPYILSLWVGREFTFLGTFLALYALWQLISVVIGFGTASLTKTVHYRRLVWQNLLINALFVGALLIFLGRFGIAAAFVALLVAGAASAAVVLGACRAANGFTYADFGRHVLLGPVLGSGAAGLALFAAARAILQMAGTAAGLGALALAGILYPVIIYFFVLEDVERARLWTAVAGLTKRKKQAGLDAPPGP
jgi:O-antigen/teichoic acid export membrane protein